MYWEESLLYLFLKLQIGLYSWQIRVQIVKHFLPVTIRKLTAVLTLLLVAVSFFVCFKYLNFSWTELDL